MTALRLSLIFCVLFSAQLGHAARVTKRAPTNDAERPQFYWGVRPFFESSQMQIASTNPAVADGKFQSNFSLGLALYGRYHFDETWFASGGLSQLWTKWSYRGETTYEERSTTSTRWDLGIDRLMIENLTLGVGYQGRQEHLPFMTPSGALNFETYVQHRLGPRALYQLLLFDEVQLQFRAGFGAIMPFEVFGIESDAGIYVQAGAGLMIPVLPHLRAGVFLLFEESKYKLPLTTVTDSDTQTVFTLHVLF